MKLVLKVGGYLLLGFLALIAAFDIWGFATLGHIDPQADPVRDPAANRVVMVLGATGSVGDGLLKAAIEADSVEKVHVVSRRSSPRIDAGVASGRVQLHLHKDFTDFSSLQPVLSEVNTVLWGLGATSIGMEDDTYTMIHVDFPLAFTRQWLSSRNQGPMSFHNVTGMGTDPNGDAHWAREKGRAELELAAMARGTPLRTFGYRSAYIRPTSEQSNFLTYLGELLLKPGKLVITAKGLGQAMLEISERSEELENGTLLDNADSIAYLNAIEG